MALYRQNATGFLCEFASNPGAGYTAVSAQPTDTLANRVNWWRGRDVDAALGQSSGWHPSLQASEPEVAKPPGLAGSGVNICSWRYSAFEETALPPLVATNCTPSQQTGGFSGTKCLRLTASAANGECYLNGSVSQYNIKLTPNRRWIISLWARSISVGARTCTVLLKTSGAGAVYASLSFTTGSAGSWERQSGVLDLRADASSNAVMGLRIAASGAIVEVDGLMMEEQIGDGANPSAYYAPDPTIDGSQLDDGSIPSAKIISLSASKLDAGTINAGVINVTNLNASNLTTGTINGSRFGSDTIGAGPLINGALHKQYILSGQANTIPFVNSTTVNTGVCFIAGPINLPANAYRSGCVILVNAFFDWNAVQSPGWLVGNVMTGFRSGSLLSRYTYWFDGRTTLSFMAFHNGGPGALSYYLGLQQKVSDPFSTLCYYDVCVLEFAK